MTPAIRNQRYVSHDEFSEFRHEVATQFQRIADKLDSRSQTNWAVWLSALSIMLVIAGMAAALVSGSISSESNSRKDADASTVGLINAMSAMNEKLTMEATKRLDDRLKVVDAEVLKLANADSERSNHIDTVLQREMRLLDNVLQREMGLHVDRLEALIEVNKKAIERMMHEPK